jgi:6-phosphogluconolactonase
MGEGPERIAIYRFDARSGELAYQGGVREGVEFPLYLETDPEQTTLYAADCRGDWKAGGSIRAFAIDPACGDLSPLGTAPSSGVIPVFVATSRRFVLAANCGPFAPANDDRTVAVLPANLSGLGAPVCVEYCEGASVDPERQTSAHPHSIGVDPAERFVLVPDLGSDEIRIYRFDADSGALTPHGSVRTPDGQGPRHVRFDPNGDFVYLVTEIGNRVFSYRWDADAGMLHPVDDASTLPGGVEDGNSAELQVHPSGRFLYATNRTHQSVAVFSLDAGKLARVNVVKTGGAFPRGFALDPDGRFAVAANERGNELVVYRVDPDSGDLQPTRQRVNTPGPACVRFVRLG